MLCAGGGPTFVVVKIVDQLPVNLEFCGDTVGCFGVFWSMDLSEGT